MALTTRKQRKADGQLELPKAPAPWSLHVKWSATVPFLIQPGFLSRFLKTNEDRVDVSYYGLGLAMIVSYSSSPAGPYDELLISVPCHYNKKASQKEWMMSRRLPLIFVSTEASLRNGRENWGIRKELADFEWSTQEGYVYGTKSVKIKDRLSGDLLLDASFAVLNTPIPVHLGFLGPLMPAIVERKIDDEGRCDTSGDWLKIRPSGFGWARPCLTISSSNKSRLFPSLWDLKGYAGVSMNGILCFPEPQVLVMDD